MKKIFNILSLISVIFAFVPASQAQEVTKYENGVGFAKRISSPDDNGVYTITLEAFVTGEVTTKMVSKPADIILVLDVTTSMNGTLGSQTQNAAGSYTYQNIVDGNYLYRPNNSGSYYPIIPYYQDNRYYACYYTRNYNSTVTQHFITSNGGNTTTIGQAAYSQNTTATLFTTGNNTRYVSTGKSRIREMQKAVKAFIDEININDLYEEYDPEHPEDAIARDSRLGNRIAIVTYAGTATTNQELKSFTDIPASSMKSIVDNFVMGTRTYTGTGVARANEILAAEKSNEERWETAGRTVVVFTDGEPTDGYDTAVGNALSTKRDYETNVFTVGMFSSTPSATDQNYLYLNYISSNYPLAQDMDTPGARNPDPKAKFYYDASGEDVDLTAIFTAIAKSSGGAGNADMTESVTTVDVVSASFTLPGENPDESLIKVYTVKCTGGSADDENITFELDEDGKEVRVQAQGKNAGRSETYRKLDENGDETGDPIDVDDAIKVTLESSVTGGKKDRINVDGFDFSSNFCGVYKGAPHGYKIVIEIPIMMDEDAVGGPAVATNTTNSGIYVPGHDDPIIKFVTPDVDLPVNIHIRKTGLRKGESAKFMIVRIPVGTEETSTTVWEPVTTVFLTKETAEGGNPEVKVRGLDPGYIYKIVEDGWSWSYKSTYTVNRTDELITNPFIFTNTQNEDIDKKVKHAESKAVNVFGSDKHVEYYDSKKTR